jgi:hypothetical protein
LEIHLDADLLAAFAERSLRDDEEASAFSHLAECETCRKYLAVNAELKEFDWGVGKHRYHDLLRRTLISRSVTTAAGIACAAIVAFCLLFPPQPFHKEATAVASKTSVNDMRAAPSIREPLVIERSRKTFAKKPCNRPRGGQITGQMPLQNLSTGDGLAARNLDRFSKEVTLVTISLGSDRTTEDAADTVVAVNQITLKTALGERRITVGELWESSRQQ